MSFIRQQFVEPLLHENSERCTDECNEETQYPESSDHHGHSGLLERRGVELWNGRVDEASVDGQIGCLIDEAHEENIGEVFGLLLKVLVRLNDECSDNHRE